ncbi:hypothetical protein GGR52DRAFT_240714 [Hypoxylon sp. FL1284]|nr:hypothetical protein GGR52DRAFT_240714 [Hypoxylon sp. FL1284]
MAPVPSQHPFRYTPLAVVGIHLLSIIYSTYAIGASLYTSYKSLGPAQDTRSRLAQRKRLIPVFLALATAALSLATYTSAVSASLSYKTWAYEHGLDEPQRFTPDEELVLEPEDLNNINFMYIGHWLSDTPIYFDALEIVAEKARRFWWGQQIDLATVAFSVLLSIEGRRRKVPLKATFLTLAHLVNLSFAQNLFYIALLLTPSPLLSEGEDLELPVAPVSTSKLSQLRNKFFPPKPKGWNLHPLALLGTLVFNYGSVSLVPYTAGTPSFVSTVLFARTSTFLPLILPAIAPMRWGTVQSHPHDAYSSYTTVFRAISVASFALHVKASVLGLVYNAPDSYYHRHSISLLPWDVEKRTTWERSTTALGKVLGSLSDHPTVQAVGWDVLLCTLSLGVWAAVRATDVQDIIKSAIPVCSSSRKAKQHAVEEYTPAASIKAESEPADDGASEHSMTLRRSGRRTKARVGSVASSSGPSEEGTLNPVTPARKRGRPKKTRQPEEEKAYEPAPSETRELVEGDVLQTDGLDGESAALAWGLVAFAGLGSACAGVFGGECISR